MKKLLILLLLFPLLAIPQEYSEVVQVEGKSKDQLYSMAREWFALTFNSANDVIQMDNPVAGKLIGKGVAQVDYTGVKVPTYMNLFYTLKVEFKDGRYKQTITVNDIKDRAGNIYSNDLLLALTTEEGARMYFEKMGITPKLMKNIDLEKYIEGNKKFIKDIDLHLKNILSDLKTAMSEPSGDDW